MIRKIKRNKSNNTYVLKKVMLMWFLAILVIIMFGYVGGNAKYGFLYLIAPDDPVTFIVELFFIFLIVLGIMGIKRVCK